MIKGAVDSVTEMILSDIPVAKVELLDELSMKALNEYSNYNYKEEPTLYLEYHGSPEYIKEQV